MLGLSGILAALLENENFTMCFSKILPTFQSIQDQSPFHTENNQVDLQLVNLLSISVEWWFEMGKEHSVFKINENAGIQILIYGLRAKEYSEPCQTSKMEYFRKIVYGFYFRKRMHPRCKPLPFFQRRSIFDGWCGAKFASGVLKYTRGKIGKSSRIFRSTILETVCKYLKSICFHKDYRRDFYSKFADFWQRKTSCFTLWATDQNSSNFLHLYINSITIYQKPRAEAAIQRCSFVMSNSCSVFFRQNLQ